MTAIFNLPALTASLTYMRDGDAFSVWSEELGLRFSGSDNEANRADLAGFAHRILVQRGQLAHDGIVELVEETI